MHACRRTFLAAIATAAGLAAGSAAAADLNLPMDEGRLITFRAPVKTVFVGNPLIADVTVVDDTHVFLVGKNFGSTNLVVLNDDGVQVANERITVYGGSTNVVTLQRGPSQTTLACADGRCQTVAVPGDDKDRYDAMVGQVEKREAGVRAAAGMQAQSQ
jgi:hypothetical protein